jgi:hypothetical protein
MKIDDLRIRLLNQNAEFEIIQHDIPIKSKKDALGYFNIEETAPTLIIQTENDFYALKYSIKRDRPFITYKDIQKETSGGGYSLPSGHTADAFATATSLSIAFPKWYVIAPSFIWASAVGYSRMDLGVHYPTDVLAGAITGSGSAYLTYKLNKWINKKRQKNILFDGRN